jgi:flagellar assembly factor FliW
MMALQSLDEEAISLLVAEPDVICPDYQPNLSPDDLAAVGLADAADARLNCVLTVRQSPLTITANLLGPIVVNPATGAAIQAVLTDTSYPTRHLLVGDERIPSPPAEPAALSERQRSQSLAAGRR